MLPRNALIFCVNLHDVISLSHPVTRCNRVTRTTTMSRARSSERCASAVTPGHQRGPVAVQLQYRRGSGAASPVAQEPVQLQYRRGSGARRRGSGARRRVRVRTRKSPGTLRRRGDSARELFGDDVRFEVLREVLYHLAQVGVKRRGMLVHSGEHGRCAL